LSDAVRKRFGETAELVAQQQDRRTAATQERLRHLLTLTGEERALDIGAGAFAIALALLVREVIGGDIVPELVEEGHKRAPANVELVEADATALRTGAARSTSTARRACCTTSRGPSSRSPRRSSSSTSRGEGVRA
jgi:ubiquinone/menaquinone biosynthesis C-methylase UbiE